MNLFDMLVKQALENHPEFAQLKIVVEKELLHHDILRIMRDHGMLQRLTFIGGTCLRDCYGSPRLSEDLDFTGGLHFSRKDFVNLADVVTKNLQDKYGLVVEVGEPIKDKLNVDTWKVIVQTRQKKMDLPAQRINIDICMVPSYEKRAMVLMNLYGINMGTSGLIIQAQSQEEIYTDKILAFALRPNRMKYRDLWDIFWLSGKGVEPNLELIVPKLADRNLVILDFLTQLNVRVQLLMHDERLIEEFYQEMYRFLPQQKLQNFNDNQFWDYIVQKMQDLQQQIITKIM